VLSSSGARVTPELGLIASRCSSNATEPTWVDSVGASHLRGIGINNERLAFAVDRVFIDHDLLHILQCRQLEHDIEQHMLEN